MRWMDDRCIFDQSKVRDIEAVRQIDGKWVRQNGQRHKQRHGVWKRVLKKCCCLAEKDITSDTNVKSASSGTIRPLFTRWCGVSVWLSPTSLHPWTLSCLPCSLLSYTFLSPAVSLLLILHHLPSPFLHNSHTVIIFLFICPYYLS